jgi:hypothetical protein
VGRSTANHSGPVAESKSTTVFCKPRPKKLLDCSQKSAMSPVTSVDLFSDIAAVFDTDGVMFIVSLVSNIQPNPSPTIFFSCKAGGAITIAITL